jgi:hypothetical protein
MLAPDLANHLQHDFILGMAFIFQRYIVSGLTAGAVKG